MTLRIITQQIMCLYPPERPEDYDVFMSLRKIAQKIINIIDNPASHYNEKFQARLLRGPHKQLEDLIARWQAIQEKRKMG